MRLLNFVMVLLITVFAITVASAHAPTTKRTTHLNVVKKVQSGTNSVTVYSFTVNALPVQPLVSKPVAVELSPGSITYNYSYVKNCNWQTEVKVEKRNRTPYDYGLVSYNTHYSYSNSKDIGDVSFNYRRQDKPPLINS